MSNITGMLDGIGLIHETYGIDIWPGHRSIAIATPGVKPDESIIRRMASYGWTWDSKEESWKYQLERR